jgi:hypothetical protein
MYERFSFVLQKWNEYSIAMKLDAAVQVTDQKESIRASAIRKVKIGIANRAIPGFPDLVSVTSPDNLLTLAGSLIKKLAYKEPRTN